MRLVALVSILLWSAQTVPAQAEKSGERCSLEGRVLDLTTSQPLRNVQLSLRSLDRNNAAATSSNDSGAFVIKDIEPGQYRLSAERNGYNRQEYGARGQSSTGTVLTLAAGQQLAALEFNLVPYGVIAGRIVDEDSEPVAGAQVSVYRYSWSKGKRRLTSAGGVVANDLGEYRVYGLGPGRYVVSASPRPTRDVNPATDARTDKVSPETAYIPTYYSGTGDASSATPVDLGPGTKLQGINFHLLSVPMARIRGHVTNHAGAGPGAESITVYALGGGLAGMRSTSVRDAKGGFELRSVPPGSYMLVASFVQNRRLYSGTLRLEAPAGQTLDGVNIEIGPGVEVGGSVRVEGDAPVKLSDITILLEPKGIESMLETTSRGIAGNGTFQFANVPPGEYDIDVVGLPDEAYLKSILLSGQDVTDSGIGVEARRRGVPPRNCLKHCGRRGGGGGKG